MKVAMTFQILGHSYWDMRI